MQNILDKLKDYDFIENYVMTINIILCTAVMWILWARQPYPVNALVLRIEFLFIGMGQAILIFYMFYCLIISILDFILDNGFRAKLYNRVIINIAIYSAIILLINTYGDNILNWVTTDPERAITILVAFVIAMIMLNIVFILHPSREIHYLRKLFYDALMIDIEQKNKLKLESSPTPKAVSNETQRYVSIHEAGHVLLYSALDQLPNKFSVVIQEYDNNPLGSVYTSISDDFITTDLFTEWYMFCLLAGKVAETLLCSEASRTESATDDNKKWLHIAQIYLTGNIEDIYYDNPKSEQEASHNAIKLNALKLKQIKQLENILSDNIELLKALADELFNKKRLNKSEIQPFLNRVRLPENFPRPKMHSKKLETGDLVA